MAARARTSARTPSTAQRKFLSSLRGDGRKWRKTLYDANPSSEYVSEALDEAAEPAPQGSQAA